MKRKRSGHVVANTDVVKTPTKPKTQTASSFSGPESDSDDANASDVLIKRQNQSARRKTARRVVEQSLLMDDASSGAEELGRVAEELETYLWKEDDDDEDEEEDAGGDDADENGHANGAADIAQVAAEPETPSKRKRGRPRKDPTRQESPPSINMSSYERYFWDNRPGAGKTSNNVFAPGSLLHHDRYFEQRDRYEEGHQEKREFLQALHESAFEQWAFELKNAFNLCLYGYGSKRAVIQALARFLHDDAQATKSSIVIINGYVSNVTMVDVLTTVASTMFPQSIKLPSTSATLLPLIMETLDRKESESLLYLLINSIDAPALRKPATQGMLATLAAHPSVRLVATVDSPNFLLLWDAPLRSRFRFLFHDCTTFVPLDAEVVDAVDSVATLLGMKTSRIGGKDGVTFVLRSLPENARHLFRILVAEQVSAGIEATDANNATASLGVEYRVLYHKAREELVCSTEHQLRMLLKEFYDHQMVESRRDALGTERLFVPFKQDELESLLEDLVE